MLYKVSDGSVSYHVFAAMDEMVLGVLQEGADLSDEEMEGFSIERHYPNDVVVTVSFEGGVCDPVHLAAEQWVALWESFLGKGSAILSCSE